jgi:hypothetical protein
MTLPLLDIQLTREYLMREREAYLAMVDNIERILEIEPRTSELRKEAREKHKLKTVVELPQATE